LNLVQCKHSVSSFAFSSVRRPHQMQRREGRKEEGRQTHLSLSLPQSNRRRRLVCCLDHGQERIFYRRRYFRQHEFFTLYSRALFSLPIFSSSSSSQRPHQRLDYNDRPTPRPPRPLEGRKEEKTPTRLVRMDRMITTTCAMNKKRKPICKMCAKVSQESDDES